MTPALKRVLDSVAVVVVACLLGGLPAEGQDWTAYKDPESRFELKYPGTWTLRTDDSSPDRYLLVVSQKAIEKVSDDVDTGLLLILMPNTHPEIYDPARLDPVGDMLRDEVFSPALANGPGATWTTSQTVDWAGGRARSSRGSVVAEGEKSETQVLIAFTPRWVTVAAFVWPTGAMPADLARLRDSVTLTGNAATRATTAGEAGIVFVRENPSNAPPGDLNRKPSGSELWVLDPGSGQARQLTHLKEQATGTEPVFVEYPAWSPDRTRIAFASNLNGEHSAYPVNLFTIAADGSDLRQITLRPEDQQPDSGGPTATITGQVDFGIRGVDLEGVTVSAGGTRVTTKTDRNGRFRLEGVRPGENWVRLWAPTTKETWGLDGENPSLLLWPRLAAGKVNDLGVVRLVNTPGTYLSRTSLTEPAWTPDGKQLLFTRRSSYVARSGNPQLMVLNDPEWIRTRGYTEPEKRNPWLPLSEWKGGVMVVLWRSQLCSIGADGRNMTTLGPVLFSDGMYPTLTPEGSKVLFKGWPFQAEQAGTDGPFAFQGNARVAVQSVSPGQSPTDLLPVLAERSSGLALSPDGRYVAFVAFGRPEQNQPAASAQGGGDLAARLLEVGAAALKMSFSGSKWGQITLYDLQTRQAQTVTNFPEADSYLTDLDFSPDGRYLVFCSVGRELRPGVNSYYSKEWCPPRCGNLFALELSTGRVVRLTEDGLSHMPSWRQ